MLLDQATLERVRTEAREIHPVRLVLLVLASLLFLVGWLAAKILGVLWVVVSWSLAAVKVGWQSGRGSA